MKIVISKDINNLLKYWGISNYCSPSIWFISSISSSAHCLVWLPNHWPEQFFILLHSVLNSLPTKSKTRSTWYFHNTFFFLVILYFFYFIILRFFIWTKNIYKFFFLLFFICACFLWFIYRILFLFFFNFLNFRFFLFIRITRGVLFGHKVIKEYTNVTFRFLFLLPCYLVNLLVYYLCFELIPSWLIILNFFI